MTDVFHQSRIFLSSLTGLEQIAALDPAINRGAIHNRPLRGLFRLALRVIAGDYGSALIGAGMMLEAKLEIDYAASSVVIERV